MLYIHCLSFISLFVHGMKSKNLNHDNFQKHFTVQHQRKLYLY